MRGFIIIVLLFFVGLRAQSQELDSARLARINEQALSVYLSIPDSAILLARQVIVDAEKFGFTNHLGESYYILSKAYWAKTNFLLSLEFGFKALQIFENSNHTDQWGKVMLSLARTMADLKNYNESAAYINKTIGLAKRNRQDHLLAHALRERSFVLAELQRYDEALAASDSAIVIFEQYKEPLEVSILYGRKSRIYFSLKNYPASRDFNKRAISIDREVNNVRALGISYFQGAQILDQLGRKDSALIYLRKSIELSTNIHNVINIVRSYQLMASIYLSQLNDQAAFSSLRLANQYQDSLITIRQSGEIEEIRALYELERQKKTIELLEKENALEKNKSDIQQLLIISFLVIILLLGAGVVIFWRLRKLQMKTNLELAEKNQSIALQHEEIQSQAKSLQQINQLKSKILSVISHDLRGPINNLYALLELVTKQNITPEEFTDMSLKLKSSLNVTQRTLENLLNWSLGQMEGIKTEPVIFNINSIIEDVAHLSEEAATRKQVILKKDIKVPLFVQADVNQVHLILRNLFNNAIKFSNRDGVVTLYAETKDKFCFVHVEDNGIGMTKSELQMLLSSNEHFTKRGTDQEKGTGLGLLLCKDFIRRNRGELFIDSEPGKGTKMTFTLPLA